MTTREIFAEHSENQACAGCHVNIDPIGFGFENYDGMGRYRRMENGLEVDASGGLFNTVDPTIQGDFDGAVELSHRLAEAGEVEDCIADHWFMFAMGRPETMSDLCSAEEVRTTFSERGNFEDLFIAITTSDSFRFRTVQTLEEQ